MGESNCAWNRRPMLHRNTLELAEQKYAGDHQVCCLMYTDSFFVKSCLVRYFMKVSNVVIRQSDQDTVQSSGGGMVKLLAFRERGQGSILGFATMISESGYVLLPSKDITEITSKRWKILNKPNPNPGIVDKCKHGNCRVGVIFCFSWLFTKISPT